MKRAIVTVGLGFGDEGKGTIVDFLVRHHKADLVVRYSGGCQAGHNVVLPDGRWHTFSQFGAGTLAGVPTWLHSNMIVDPFAMVREASHLKEIGVSDPFRMLSVHPRCLVATPFHRDANRYRESRRGDGRHGSCGMGVGECRRMSIERPDEAIRVEDLFDRPRLLNKLATLDSRLSQDPELGAAYTLENAYRIADRYIELSPLLTVGIPERFETVVFEGSQGILLDEAVGFHPHTTWSDVTLNAARIVRADLGIDEYTNIGITRCFSTRHGPGRFTDELQGELLPNDHNQPNRWQGSLRVGALDQGLLSYACRKAGDVLNWIALTWLDYQPLGCRKPEEKLIEDVTEATRTKARILSSGPTWESKRIV